MTTAKKFNNVSKRIYWLVCSQLLCNSTSSRRCRRHASGSGKWQQHTCFASSTHTFTSASFRFYISPYAVRFFLLLLLLFARYMFFFLLHHFCSFLLYFIVIPYTSFSIVFIFYRENFTAQKSTHCTRLLLLLMSWLQQEIEMHTQMCVREKWNELRK